MQYLFLKNIINTLLSSFRCPDCQSAATEEGFSLQSVSPKGVEMMFQCGKCHAKTLMKAEMNQLSPGFLTSDAGKAFMQHMIQEQRLDTNSGVSPAESIPQEEITRVDKILSEHSTISDLINGI